MHQGKLPELPDPDEPLPDHERPAFPTQDAAARPRWTRRLVLLLGLGAGAAAGYRLGSGGTARREVAVPPGPTNAGAPRGNLAWALGMRDAEPALLLAAAGDLERVSMRHRGAADLALLEAGERRK